jgi:class 3 adenylate cyclase
VDRLPVAESNVSRSRAEERVALRYDALAAVTRRADVDGDNAPGSSGALKKEGMGRDIEVAILFADVVGSTQAL